MKTPSSLSLRFLITFGSFLIVSISAQSAPLSEADRLELESCETFAFENYHHTLTTAGGTEYPYQNLLQDYLLCILAYVPHSLAWGNYKSMEVACRHWSGGML